MQTNFMVALCCLLELAALAAGAALINKEETAVHVSRELQVAPKTHSRALRDNRDRFKSSGSDPETALTPRSGRSARSLGKTLLKRLSFIPISLLALNTFLLLVDAVSGHKNRRPQEVHGRWVPITPGLPHYNFAYPPPSWFANLHSDIANPVSLEKRSLPSMLSMLTMGALAGAAAGAKKGFEMSRQMPGHSSLRVPLVFPAAQIAAALEAYKKRLAAAADFTDEELRKRATAEHWQVDPAATSASSEPNERANREEQTVLPGDRTQTVAPPSVATLTPDRYKASMTWPPNWLLTPDEFDLSKLPTLNLIQELILGKK